MLLVLTGAARRIAERPSLRTGLPRHPFAEDAAEAVDDARECDVVWLF